MNEKTPILTADYITTEHDYIYTYLAQQKYETSKVDRAIMGILGIIIIFLGLYMLIFIGGSFVKTVCWLLLVAIGLFLVSFHEIINPSLTRIRAKNEYNVNKDKFSSRSIIFYEEEVKIVSDRYKGNIPYKYFFRILEDKKVIILYLDKNDYISIPKRLFTDKDDEALKKIESLVDDKYIKIR